MNREEVLKIIRTEIKPIEDKISGISQKFEELKNSIQFISDKYDLLLTKEQTSCKRITDLADLSNCFKSEIKLMKEEIEECLKESDEISQYLRRDCLEVTGVDAKDENQCIEVMKSIAETLGLPSLDDSDISIAHPLPRFKKDSPPKLIAKFTRRSVKNSFYDSKKKLSGKAVSDLPNLPEELHNDNKVFLGESLTQKRKKLFGEANKLRKELRWKFIWTMNGKVYLREDTQSRSISFSTMEEFNGFRSQHVHSPHNHATRPRQSTTRGRGRGR